MKLLKASPDGGPNSPVRAYFLIESKRFFSVALLRFNSGGREAYHTHAFAALTWFLCGDLAEELYGGVTTTYRRSFWPKVTRKNNNHRVRARRDSWCLTVRGPWEETWTEDVGGVRTVFGWGRRVLRKEVSE